MNPRQLPADLAIQYVAFATADTVVLSRNRLRVWAHRHPGISAGRAPDNTALYDVDGILKYLETRRVIAQAHKPGVI